RQPRMMTASKNLRDFGQWHSEILREKSTKVSKIQDGALHDLSSADTLLTLRIAP
ncbi:hypothetical protein FIBSPDRAFT_730276, partial [Athelia psychrophila]